MKGHNKRQLALHSLLINNHDRYLTRREILLELAKHYFPNKDISIAEIMNADLYNLKEGMTLNKDIKAIKDSNTIKRVLISNSKKGLKYANKREALDFFEREKIIILKKFKTYHHQIKKCNLNGQVVIQFTGEDKEIIESLIGE